MTSVYSYLLPYCWVKSTLLVSGADGTWHGKRLMKALLCVNGISGDDSIWKRCLVIKNGRAYIDSKVVATVDEIEFALYKNGIATLWESSSFICEGDVWRRSDSTPDKLTVRNSVEHRDIHAAAALYCTKFYAHSFDTLISTIVWRRADAAIIIGFAAVYRTLCFNHLSWFSRSFHTARLINVMLCTKERVPSWLIKC